MAMRWIHAAVPALIVGHLAIGCSDFGDDCRNSSKCGGASGTSSGGVSGVSGDAGEGNGGTGADKAGSAAGGKGGSTSAGSGPVGGGGSGEAGAGGTPALPCDGACTGDKPVCKVATDTCVECLASSDCTTDGQTKCATNTNTCVACLDATSDCASATASRCEGGACVECQSNDDCAHVAGKGVCDDGACVQCSVGDDGACAGKSCDAETNSCTNTTKGSVANCKPCLADSECVGGNQADPDARCVPMEFQGVLRPGGFCLRRGVKTCARPYTIGISVKSLSGAAAENYCGIDQENVTCEAVVDLEDSRTCTGLSDSACGCTRDQDGNCTDTGEGGLCRDFAVVQDQCTYQCGTANDCPTGKVCLGSPTKYCQ